MDVAEWQKQVDSWFPYGATSVEQPPKSDSPVLQIPWFVVLSVSIDVPELFFTPINFPSDFYWKVLSYEDLEDRVVFHMPEGATVLVTPVKEGTPLAELLAKEERWSP